MTTIYHAQDNEEVLFPGTLGDLAGSFRVRACKGLLYIYAIDPAYGSCKIKPITIGYYLLNFRLEQHEERLKTNDHATSQETSGNL